jgi:hypothetical protein
MVEHVEHNEIEEFWRSVKEGLDKACKEHDATWQKRSRILNSKIITLMIIKIIMSNKHQGISINLIEIWERCAEKNISLPQAKPVTASSFCEARQKVSENIFKSINHELLKKWETKRSLPLWFGHRVYAVDGSRLNIPRDLTKYGYKIYDEERRHYPQGLLSCLYNVLTKTIYDFDFVSHMNERFCALKHLDILQANDVVVFDRGYFSYLLLHELHKKGIHALFRLQEGTVNKQVESFINSSETDKIIDYKPSGAVISDLKKQGYFLKPEPIPLRLIKHYMNGEMYLYGTTLLGGNYSASDFFALYHERWSIEELYKISKNIIDVEDFHSKTERGVKQEIYAHLLLINLGRFIEYDANNRLPIMNEADKEKCNQIDFTKFFNSNSMFNLNFKNCITVVGRYIENIFLDGFEEIKSWTAKIVNAVLNVRQKIRPGRSFPRRSYKPDKKWGKKGKKAAAAY